MESPAFACKAASANDVGRVFQHQRVVLLFQHVVVALDVLLDLDDAVRGPQQYWRRHDLNFFFLLFGQIRSSSKMMPRTGVIYDFPWSSSLAVRCGGEAVRPAEQVVVLDDLLLKLLRSVNRNACGIQRVLRGIVLILNDTRHIHDMP